MVDIEVQVGIDILAAVKKFQNGGSGYDHSFGRRKFVCRYGFQELSPVMACNSRKRTTSSGAKYRCRVRSIRNALLENADTESLKLLQVFE